MSCHSATANQVRLVLHTAAFWLMHGVRTAIPRTNALACGEFATIRERLIKIGARVIEPIARIRIAQPHAVWPMRRRGRVSDGPPTRQINPNALQSEWPYTDPTRRVADARPPTRREKTRRVAHDCG
jgi:Transposase DDE domain group 1